MISIEGNIVNIDKTSRGRIEIGDGGLISRVAEPTGQADIVLNDELIFPGFIDLHVHARECADHSWDYKEDFTTAGAAAINGGVVAFADMPNNPVPPVDDKSYADKYQLAQKCAVDVLLYAGITSSTKPLSVSFRGVQPTRNPLNFVKTDKYKESLRSSSDALVVGRDDRAQVPYKVYMAKSTGDLSFQSGEQLEAAIKKYPGQNISFHCEDPKILEENKEQAVYGLRRPPEAEIKAVEFALELTEKYQLTAKICHCSTVKGVELVIAAKKRGLPVTVEIAPHHLYFDEGALTPEKQVELRINPPVRNSPQDRLKLIEYLKNGDIDYLATDHSPHSAEDKAKGATGMPHLDTYGPFAAWLMKEHNFTPADIVRVCSFNPGRFMNDFMSMKYGKIAPGFVGSLTVLDMNRPITISKSMLKTKCGWSPFEGVQFPGRVVYTVVKGKVYNIL